MAQSRPLWRFRFFSKRAFNAVSSSSRLPRCNAKRLLRGCFGDNSFFISTPFISLDGFHKIVGEPYATLKEIQIHHQRQIQPTLGGQDISQITGPHLVGASGRRQLGQPVRGDGMIVVAIGGARYKTIALLSPHTVALHQTRHAILTASMAQSFELGRQARTAVTTFRSLV